MLVKFYCKGITLIAINQILNDFFLKFVRFFFVSGLQSRFNGLFQPIFQTHPAYFFYLQNRLTAQKRRHIAPLTTFNIYNNGRSSIYY